MPGAPVAGKLHRTCDPGKLCHRDVTSPALLPSRARIQASEEPLGKAVGWWPLCRAVADTERREARGRGRRAANPCRARAPLHRAGGRGFQGEESHRQQLDREV